VGRAPDTNPVNLELKEIPAEETVCIESIGVIDVDAKAKTILIGYSDGSKTFWFLKKDAPATDYSIEWTGRLYLDEKHKVVAQVYNPTSGDNLLLVANGYFIECGE